MKFSVIIPTYNRKKLLSSCLRSLFNQDYSNKGYEIIVIDDGSIDGTELLVKSLMKKHNNVRYFKTNQVGPGIARNVGLRKAKGEFIAFTDDDCIVDRDWLRKIECVFVQTNADAVGGSIVNPTNRYVAWAQYILNFSSWFPKGRDRYVKNIPTAHIVYRKSVIKEHFFLDQLSKWGYEDSLYNFYLYKKNKRILFCPNIKVKHYTWYKTYGLKKFFKIQKRNAIGFILGGYEVHGKIGRILRNFPILNLFCPGLLMIFLRCIRYGYLNRFIIHFPLILSGEFYKGIIICSINKNRLK